MTEPTPGVPNVVPLDADVVPGHGETPIPSGPTSRLHGLAITGMAVSALAGIVSTIAFVTVGWTGAAAHYVIAVIVLSGVAFLACASAAVFTAARDAFAVRAGPGSEPGDASENDAK